MTQRFTRSLMIFGFAIAAACTVLRWWDPPVLQDLRNNAFDWYQRIYPRPPANVPVRIVDIDENSLKELGQWPWPRDLVAELLAKLGERGAAVVAFDVIFSEPDRLSPRNVMAQTKNLDPSIVAGLRDNDEVFARQIAGQPVVLGFAATVEGGPMPASKSGFAFLGQSPILAPPHFQHATAPLPALSEVASGLGDISMDPRQRNAVVRTVPLFLSDGVQLYPSLEMEALRVAQGASTYVVKNAPERPASIEAVRVGNFEVPTTEDGELWLYMAPESSDRYVSAWDVISGPMEKTAPLIKGNIVFVGTSAAGLLDIRATALAQNVPGVSIHAQAVEQILTGRFLLRPNWVAGLEIVGVAALSLTILFLIAAFSPWVAVTIGSMVSLLVVIVSWVAFRRFGLLLDVTFPIMTSFATQFATVAYRFLVTDYERRQIRRVFSQYVSPGVLARAESQPEAMHLGGVDREITVLFMDVRDFTTISEGMGPTALVGFLNKLLSGLSRHVIAGEGTLDKFIGDSIMAFWNAPVDVSDHAAKAARCALLMRSTMRDLNDQKAFGFEQRIAIGIGINTGVACVGNIGAENRFNYSAVGDTVNAAARIESTSKELAFDILVSETTAAMLPGFALLDAGYRRVKGKSVRLRIFLLIGDEMIAQTHEFQTLRETHTRLLASLAHSLSERNSPFLAEAILVARPVLPELKRYYERLVDHTTVDSH